MHLIPCSEINSNCIFFLFFWGGGGGLSGGGVMVTNLSNKLRSQRKLEVGKPNTNIFLTVLVLLLQ